MKEDEWSTGLGQEVWDARPEDSKESARDRIHRRKMKNRVWVNSFGDEFKDGDRIRIKKHTWEFSDQGPSYTTDMAAIYEKTEQVINTIRNESDVTLKGEGFTWNIDWFESIKPPLADELFEI